MQSRRLSLLVSAWVILLGACGPPPGRPVTLPESTPRFSATRPFPSPTPPLNATIRGLVLLPGPPPNSWTALGMLDNRGSTPIQDVSLRVSLIDDQGTTLEQTKVPLAVPVLAGHGEVPFSAEFKARAGTRVEVEIVSYGIAQSPPLPLQIEVVRRTKTGDGQLAVMGRLTNPGADPIRVVGLVLSATDADNVLAGLSSNWFGLTGLAPKQTPFILRATRQPKLLPHLPRRQSKYPPAQPCAWMTRATQLCWPSCIIGPKDRLWPACWSV
jgi:hypothetical protein